MNLLKAQDICFAYAERQVLNSVNLIAKPGEFIVLMGVNGAGKSTLLDILAGLRSPHSGNVYLEDKTLGAWSAKQRSARISHLPQGTQRDLPFSVEQMVLMGRYASAESWFESDDDHRYAQEAMQRMDCFDLRHRRYATLSGGEQQRVLLATCIAQHPSILLFDEPSTYLDVHQQLQCFSTIADLARGGALCIAVTHDLNLALAYCTRLVILHQSRLAVDLPIEEAASDPAWLQWLSPRLELTRTPDGRPWVVYR
ncbi:MAG TPA: ABC transporter ATP-binding protein [Bryobacteraceae bacterium]|jgi:iron complex transport system ATP-binding protein